METKSSLFRVLLFAAIITVLVAVGVGVARAQDLDGIGSVVGPGVSGPASGGESSWNLILDDPTESDCDIATIKAKDKAGNETKIVAQVTSLAGYKKKDKAKKLAEEINKASALKWDPIEAVASNGVILLTANAGFSIEAVSFDNATKQEKNSVKEIDAEMPAGSKLGAIRLSGDILGKTVAGDPSVLNIGFNDVWIEVNLEHGDDIFDLLVSIHKWLSDNGIPAWVAVDTDGGYWLFYNVPILNENGMKVSSVNFGNTDYLLEQKVYSGPMVYFFYGVTQTFLGADIFILLALGVDIDEVMPHY